MPPAKELDPSASPQALYGAELRHLRETAGLSQTDLGKLVLCSGAFIGQLEAGTRRMPPDLAQRLDVGLGTNGFFERHCGAMRKSKHADYFAEAAELEPYAKSICTYAQTFVPGLLQTEEYARAVTSAAMPVAPIAQVDRLVSGRLERARILDHPTTPSFWAILDENVLRRCVGGPATMAGQLMHIAETVRRRRVLIQVLPLAAGAHALMGGMATVMAFPDDAPVVYTEGQHTGQLLDDPALVARYMESYDLVRAAALPPEASLALIESTAEDYTHANDA
ncbi:helix-turn-helix domain-containing protein [Streptomyces gamaensis]|uniref:Helix-turn-helix domain-containing protein n=1 Tax=Streptomyces gamaensis TaxID=1763542 RepID=A0ABW0Z5F0_9ACTN